MSFAVFQKAISDWERILQHKSQIIRNGTKLCLGILYNCLRRKRSLLLDAFIHPGYQAIARSLNSAMYGSLYFQSFFTRKDSQEGLGLYGDFGLETNMIKNVRIFVTRAMSYFCIQWGVILTFTGRWLVLGEGGEDHSSRNDFGAHVGSKTTETDM